MPSLFIIAGPNGVGKTTYAREFLRREMNVLEFLNGDLIATGLSPFAPERAAFEAGRILLRRMRELAATRADFALETTLSGRTYFPLLQQMRAAGYRIHLDFLWAAQLDITKSRVRGRVRSGGHNIPDQIQERRFLSGINNLLTLYRPVVHHWRLYDNTLKSARLVAREKDGSLVTVNRGLLAILERSANLRFMPTIPTHQAEEAAPFSEDFETRASMRAMRRAFARAVLENAVYQTPIIQWDWERSVVVEVPSESLVPLARRILELNGEEMPEEEHC